MIILCGRKSELKKNGNERSNPGVAGKGICAVKGERLDLLVVQKGLLPSRESARTAIMDGAILVNGQKATKPGMPVSPDANIELVASFTTKKFASRGGLKLERALADFQISVKDRICLDIGASTGGFTDCLLKSEAKLVYAIDVGYGQLEWQLRQDTRVRVFERLNARYLTPEKIYGKADQWADLAVIDVSFISLKKIFPACLCSMASGKAEIICLIKPQFEIGREKVGKGGVVNSQQSHIEVIQAVLSEAQSLGLQPHGLVNSPIKGPAGNIEFLAHLSKDPCAELIDIQSVVLAAHQVLA
jgi:23S rRNA (cytidine1920-2'-O)/16S rRNA (cytidine1409-2'-O)-methyltransferase